MVENCIGTISIPLGVALNFVINHKKYIIPMAIEEPSVIAAASNAAKIICQNSFGFISKTSNTIVRGQIFLQNLKTENPFKKLKENHSSLKKFANKNLCSSLDQRGGGVTRMFLEKIH